jgi:hypothetical protein
MEDVASLRAAVGELCSIDPSFGGIEAAAGPLAFRRRPPGFATLVRILVGQQLSTAAAATIYARLEAASGGVVPEFFLTNDDAALRARAQRPKIALYPRARHRDLDCRARSRWSRRLAGRELPCRADRDQRHRRLDGPDLSARCARPPGCLAGWRHRVAGGLSEPRRLAATAERRRTRRDRRTLAAVAQRCREAALALSRSDEDAGLMHHGRGGGMMQSIIGFES